MSTVLLLIIGKLVFLTLFVLSACKVAGDYDEQQAKKDRH